MQVVEDLRSPGRHFSGVHQPAQKDVHGRQRQREPRHVHFVHFLNHGVGFKEIDSGIDERQHRRDRRQDRMFAIRLQRDQRSNGEDRKKQAGICQRQLKRAAVVEGPIPAQVQDQRAHITHHQQAPPRPERHQHQRCDIENRHIREQRDFSVLPGREKDRR